MAKDWRGRGVLSQDSAPSLYVYSQRFAVPGSGTQQDRRGFMALGRVEDYSAKVVFRHEQTLAKPKADRLDLLRATRAHFEQLFMLYEDSGEIESALTTGTQTTPTIEVTDEYGVLNRVWRISDAAVIDSVCRQMSSVITALTWRRSGKGPPSVRSYSLAIAVPMARASAAHTSMASIVAKASLFLP